jgi:hypothetical protein
MLDINSIDSRFDALFFIASFHHLDNYNDRVNVLKKAYNLLEK